MQVLANSLLRRFGSNEQGSVAITFALMSILIMFAAGMALDTARTYHMNDRVGHAVDAATIAAGRALLDGDLSDDEIKERAAAYITENVAAGGGNFGTYATPDIQINRDEGTVTIDVDVNVPTTLTRLGGFKKLSAPISTAAVFDQKDIEVAMALDVTGSMRGSTSDGVIKINALKQAFKTFADKLLPEKVSGERKVRIGVAPYSSGVNLDAFAGAATNNRSKDNCVIERTGGARYTDEPVGGGLYFKVHEDQPRDIDNTQRRQSYTCPDATVIPLTDDRDLLISTVEGYDASGSTGGHLGVQWAWNLIAEQWGGFWGGESQPDPYSLTEGDNPKLIKAVILMTDGVFNTSFFNDVSAAQATELCKKIKAKNVRVFSIAFGDPPSQAKQTLEQCATPGTEYYADASDAKQLEAALSKFALKLNALRLSK